MQKDAILYEIINTITGLRYIGVTRTKLSSRWGVHLYKLRHSIASPKLQDAYYEYGESAFCIKEIKRGLPDDMWLLEKELTKETLINGYNSIIGGNDSEERREAAFIFREKLNADPEFKKKYFKSIADKNRGKKMSDEARVKMSAKKKGVKWEQYKKDNRAKQYSGDGNPNSGNYKIFLNTQNGIFYTTPEIMNLLNKTKSGMKWMFKTNNYLIRDFIKV